MSKSALSVIAGSLLLSQAVAASDSWAESGRYSLVPDAQVPNAQGKSETRAVLLDSKTGQTWVMVRDDNAGSGAAMKWVPIDIAFKEQAKRQPVQIDTSEPAQNHRATQPKPQFERENGRKTRLNAYDNDP